MLHPNNLPLDALIDAINVELETGNWAQVVTLTATLYAAAIAQGEDLLAELVQDMHWIANDALVRPTLVGALVQP